jgi:hypothetical protein
MTNVNKILKFCMNVVYKVTQTYLLFWISHIFDKGFVILISKKLRLQYFNGEKCIEHVN